MGRLSREPLVNSGASLQNCKLDPARGASASVPYRPMYASSAFFCFRTEARKCEGILFPRSHPQQLCFAAWSVEFPTWQKNCQYSSITLSFFSLTWLREQEEKKRRLSCRDWNLESLFANLKYGRGHRGRPFALTRRGKAVHLKCALACSRSLSSFSKDTFAKERMKIEGKNGRRPTRE